MQSTAKAVYEFFNSFGLDAYDINAVPDDAKLPYITYMVNEPEWNRQATAYAQVWYRTKSRATVNAKADQIVAAIGTGVRLDCDGGYVVIWPESPLVQPIANDDVLGAYINLSINAYHMPGM